MKTLLLHSCRRRQRETLGRKDSLSLSLHLKSLCGSILPPLHLFSLFCVMKSPLHTPPSIDSADSETRHTWDSLSGSQLLSVVGNFFEERQGLNLIMTVNSLMKRKVLTVKGTNLPFLFPVSRNKREKGK